MELIGFGCLTYAGPVTLIAALRDNDDVVIASDTRVLNMDLSVRCDGACKTLPVNDNLLIAIGGYTEYGVQILRALGFRCQDTNPVSSMRSCLEEETPMELKYRAARDIIAKEVSRIIPSIDPQDGANLVPGVILAGRLRGVPSLCSWGGPEGKMIQWPLLGFSAAVVGKPPPEGTIDCDTFQELAYKNLRTRDSESNLIAAFRYCADYWGDTGPVSRDLFLHRLSDPFHPTKIA